MKAALECDRLYSLLPGTLVRHKEQLKRLLRERSLVRGKFTLSSGKTSDYYIDCKLTTLDPKGAVLTGHTILEHLEEHGIQADAIGGPEIGAIPIVAAVAAISYLRATIEKRGTPLPAFLVRKERKDHGLQKQIEGIDPIQVQKVIIVDEVCTGGASIEVALKAVETQHLEVAAVISLVDREEGGHVKLRAKYGDRYLPVFTAKELAEEQTHIAESARHTKSIRSRILQAPTRTYGNRRR